MTLSDILDTVTDILQSVIDTLVDIFTWISGIVQRLRFYKKFEAWWESEGDDDMSKLEAIREHRKEIVSNWDDGKIPIDNTDAGILVYSIIEEVRLRDTEHDTIIIPSCGMDSVVRATYIEGIPPTYDSYKDELNVYISDFTDSVVLADMSEFAPKDF